MLEVAQATFAVACFWGLLDIYKCLGCLQMASYPLDKQTASCNSTWLAVEFGHKFSCFVWYVEVKMASMDAIWWFLVKT